MYNCYRSKIQRYTKSPIGIFSLPDVRYAHIYIDFIGPFSPSDGYTFCLTITDLFTRWPEIIPTTNITTEAVCKALIPNWIARFVCLVTITTDRGKNFESHLFKHLTDIIGTNRIRTISYHSQSKGLVERFRNGKYLFKKICDQNQKK